MEISVWDKYVAASERALVKEKDLFLSVIKLQYRIARRLYDLLSVEPRPVQDSTLGAAASFASTYIKELSALKLPEKLLAEAADLAKKSLETRTELIISFTLRRQPFIAPIHKFIAGLVCSPLASICYCIDRPNVQLRGPSGCGSTKQREEGTASGRNKGSALGCPAPALSACDVNRLKEWGGACPACGHPPLYMIPTAAGQAPPFQLHGRPVEKAGQADTAMLRCSLCFNSWVFNPSGCMFCGGSDLEVGPAGAICEGKATGIPSVKGEDFPFALFSTFNSAYSRQSHTISEEWNSLLR